MLLRDVGGEDRARWGALSSNALIWCLERCSRGMSLDKCIV